MAGLIASNLLRHKARTIATAVGIALGVGMIVALLSVGSGLKRTAGQLVNLGHADMGIFQSGVADPTASVLPTSMVERLERRSDVAEATPLLLLVTAVKEYPAAIVFGAEPDGFFAQRLVTTEGHRQLGPGEVMVGDGLANKLDLRPGSPLAIEGHRMRVAGIYHTGIFFEDTGATIDLATAQQLEHRRNEATTIAVQLRPSVPLDAAEQSIKDEFTGISVIGTPDEASRLGANGELVSKAVTIIATLALILGGLGVTNTMAMAVLERERELALLERGGLAAAPDRLPRPRRGSGHERARCRAGDADRGHRRERAQPCARRLLGRLAPRHALDHRPGAPDRRRDRRAGGLYPAWRGTTVAPTRVLGGA